MRHALDSPVLQLLEVPDMLSLVSAGANGEDGNDLGSGECVELELGDDTEATTSATQSPEEVGVLCLGAVHDRTVSQDDGSPNHPVESEPMGM